MVQAYHRNAHGWVWDAHLARRKCGEIPLSFLLDSPHGRRKSLTKTSKMVLQCLEKSVVWAKRAHGVQCQANVFDGKFWLTRESATRAACVGGALVLPLTSTPPEHFWPPNGRGRRGGGGRVNMQDPATTLNPPYPYP